MPDDYDVVRETEFNRENLQTAIPNRLKELGDIVWSRRTTGDNWFEDLIVKIVQSVDRTCRDLLETMPQDALPAAAWNARNLLELSIWIKYCAVSRANARCFHEGALRDMQGLTDAVSKLHALRQLPNEFEKAAREKIAEIAREKLGLNSLDGSYARVADAAKSVCQLDWFLATNSFLSKFAHPTAGLVIGFMHQTEIIRKNMQAIAPSNGVYSAGQCVIGLVEIVAPPAI